MEPFWLFFGQGQRIWTGACGGICESPWGNDVFHLFGGGIRHILAVQCSQKTRSHEKGTGRQNRQKMV